MQLPSLVSAYPSKERAELARRSFYFKMISSLAYLVSIASRDDQNTNILSLVRNPVSATTLNPRIFYLHDTLLSAMRAQDVETARKVLRTINEVATQGIEKSANPGPEILTIDETDWEQFIVNNSKILGEEYFKERPIIDPVSEETVRQQKQVITGAIKVIADNFPGMHDELKAFLNKIRIFEGTVTMGITDVRMFGCMLIRTPRKEVNAQLYYAEHLTHEISHMYLNAAMSLDPVILNDRSELFTSPIRPDPRPMLGVFHATFVTARIVQLFSALANSSGDDETGVYLYQQLDELQAGIEEIARGAKLTPVGMTLLAEFREIAKNAEELSLWSSFDETGSYEHRFGGGACFKRARDRLSAPSTL
ncbi:HEXXH motif-containing putative peptide modification protein [Pararhizobium sp. LjRoot235]|uniref:aKG-HExxH-type peptide beta-hydroxylase n=1 Tax=Pararhizobium sp. LjRoot235 TaxID=3342291 RepID=UPI003ECE6B4E